MIIVSTNNILDYHKNDRICERCNRLNECKECVMYINSYSRDKTFNL